MATRLTSITLERFQGYRDRQRIALKPLTVLCGPNRAGKSAPIRALLMLQQTLRAPSPAIPLQLGGCVDPDLRALTWGRPAGASILGPTIRIGWEVQEMPFSLELSTSAEGQTVALERVQLSTGFMSIVSERHDRRHALHHFIPIAARQSARKGAPPAYLAALNRATAALTALLTGLHHLPTYPPADLPEAPHALIEAAPGDTPTEAQAQQAVAHAMRGHQLTIEARGDGWPRRLRELLQKNPEAAPYLSILDISQDESGASHITERQPR